MAKHPLQQEGVWRLALGILAPLLYLPSLALIPRSKFIFGGLLAFYLSLSIRKTAHHLGCEYFDFYGNDLWLQVKRLKLRLWLATHIK